MSEKTGAKTEKNGTGFVVHRAALMVLFVLVICQIYWDLVVEPISISSNRFQYFAGLSLIGLMVWDIQKLETFWSRARGLAILGLTLIVFSPVAIAIWTEMGWV